MGAITTAFTFVWVLNILMFLSQATIIEIGPSNPVTVYNCSGTIVSQYAGEGCSSIIVPNSDELQDQLGIESSRASEKTGFVIIDVLLDIKGWFADKIEYLGNIVSAPYSILSQTGLPSPFVGAVSLLWYGLSILLLIAFIFGRNT